MTAMTPIRRARASAVVAAAVLLAGCTSVVPGAAQRAAGGPPAGAVDPALLDHGNYPVTALPPMGVAGTPAKGALLDARRMGDFVIGPWQVDPELVKPWGVRYGPGVMPLKPDALGAVFDGADSTAAAGALVNGFASGREAPGRLQLLNVVLRMPDPRAAEAAVTELGRWQVQTRAAQTPPAVMTPVPVPGHPQTQALGESFVDGADQHTWYGVHALTAHGSYVLFQVAYSAVSTDVAATTVASMLDVQGPRIDAFAPTDPAQFAALPVDPSGLLAKALPVPQGEGNVSNRATFGPEAMLHYEANPVAANSRQVFTDAGVDVAVHGKSWIYRARDQAGATAVADMELRGAGGEPADAVPGLPGSRCGHDPQGGRYWCVGVADRYAFQVFGGAQLRDVHQQTAAQYLLLTAT